MTGGVAKKTLAVSPLAPRHIAALPPVAGVRLAAASANIRYKDKRDVLLVECAQGTTVAGVFTRSLAPSAPVEWCRTALLQGHARALVVNSGNANAFTGKAGEAAALRVATSTAKLFDCSPQQVFMASTGVIGELLPDEKITAALNALHTSLSDAAWADAVEAIMTTDTFPKQATRTARIGDATVTINGIAKGSGMIAPDMATMLAFIFTDAALPHAVLQSLLAQANEISFNAITVDSDTSTSDTALLFATGMVKHPPISQANDPALADFAAQLNSLVKELAQLIVKDGEGAQKFITVTVSGAESDTAARRIALSIGNSPLVKTAIAGEDANWGRIVMAVGKAGEKADRDRLTIDIGGVRVAEKGAVAQNYNEADVMPHMQGADIAIAVDVGVGKGSATIWTCDLTHGYIDINGSYRS